MKLTQTLEILYKFNRATLTGRDFLNLCRLNNVTVIISADTQRGFYWCVDKKHFIALPAKASISERRFLKWHEFAHFLMNFREQKTIVAFSNMKPDEAHEKLADVFAKIALDPAYITICDPRGFIKMLIEGE